MESKFPWAFRPSEQEIADIWAGATVSVDSSVLLNLYQYGPDAREQLLGAMERIGDRLWLPYKAVEEFLWKREEVIVRQDAGFREIRQAFKAVSDALTKYERDRSVDVRLLPVDLKQLQDLAKRAIHESNKVLGEAEKHHIDVADDPVLRRLNEIVGDRSGDAIPNAERETRYREARARYERQVPPGYVDNGKQEPEKFGDFLVWRELLDHASEVKRPVVLVTDDLKPDWWLRQNQWPKSRRPKGQKADEPRLIGPRHELMAEMQRVAGVRFHLSTSDDFLRYAQQSLGIEKNEAVIEEVREVARSAEALTAAATTQRAAPARDYRTALFRAPFADLIERPAREQENPISVALNHITRGLMASQLFETQIARAAEGTAPRASAEMVVPDWLVERSPAAQAVLDYGGDDADGEEDGGYGSGGDSDPE